MVEMTPEQLEIVLKVKELYLKYGIKSVTMDDACREIGISKKTMYQHFTDKSQLVEAAVMHEMEHRSTHFHQMIASSEDAIAEMVNIHQYMDRILKTHSHTVDYDMKKYYPALYNELSKQRHNHILSIHLNNINRGQAEGLYRTEVNPEIIAKMSLIRVDGCIDGCVFSVDELNSHQVFIGMMIYHIRGIATSKGIARLEELLKEQ